MFFSLFARIKKVSTLCFYVLINPFFFIFRKKVSFMFIFIHFLFPVDMFIPNYESNHSSQFFEKFLRRKISKNVCILIYDVFFPFFIINKLDKKKNHNIFSLFLKIKDHVRPLTGLLQMKRKKGKKYFPYLI